MTLEASEASIAVDDLDFPLKMYRRANFQNMRAWSASKEPWTYQWLKEIGTGLFFDLGACIGIYSLMAAVRGARVVALEPVPINYQECLANAELNGLSERISFLNCAVGAYNGTSVLYASTKLGYGQASRQNRHLPHQTECITVQVRTLDDIAAEYGYPAYVKMDVEGSEVEALRGAPEVLDRVESVICEIQNDQNEGDVIMVMQAHGIESTWNGGRRTDDERTHIFRRKR